MKKIVSLLLVGAIMLGTMSMVFADEDGDFDYGGYELGASELIILNTLEDIPSTIFNNRVFKDFTALGDKFLLEGLDEGKISIDELEDFDKYNRTPRYVVDRLYKHYDVPSIEGEYYGGFTDVLYGVSNEADLLTHPSYDFMANQHLTESLSINGYYPPATYSSNGGVTTYNDEFVSNGAIYSDGKGLDARTKEQWSALSISNTITTARYDVYLNKYLYYSRYGDFMTFLERHIQLYMGSRKYRSSTTLDDVLTDVNLLVSNELYKVDYTELDYDIVFSHNYTTYILNGEKINVHEYYNDKVPASPGFYIIGSVGIELLDQLGIPCSDRNNPTNRADYLEIVGTMGQTVYSAIGVVRGIGLRNNIDYTIATAKVEENVAQDDVVEESVENKDTSTENTIVPVVPAVTVTALAGTGLMLLLVPVFSPRIFMTVNDMDLAKKMTKGNIDEIITKYKGNPTKNRDGFVLVGTEKLDYKDVTMSKEEIHSKDVSQLNKRKIGRITMFYDSN